MCVGGRGGHIFSQLGTEISFRGPPHNIKLSHVAHLKTLLFMLSPVAQELGHVFAVNPPRKQPSSLLLSVCCFIFRSKHVYAACQQGNLPLVKTPKLVLKFEEQTLPVFIPQCCWMLASDWSESVGYFSITCVCTLFNDNMLSSIGVAAAYSDLWRHLVAIFRKESPVTAQIKLFQHGKVFRIVKV